MGRREPSNPTEAVLRVHRDKGAHEVPVDVLARALLGVQQTAVLIVAATSRQAVRERFRPTERLRERAMLVCEVPTPGSFAVPLRLADGPFTLPIGQGREIGLMEAIQRLLSSVQTGANAFAWDLMPDSAIRMRTLRELQRFLPQPGEPWAIGFSSYQREETILDERALRVIDDWLARETAPEAAVMTVTGKLVGVFFDEKRILIDYKPTNKQINCFLRDDVVDAILEDRVAKLRSGGSFQIQVTGQFVLDRNEHPKKLTDVYRVASVDTSPMVFERIYHQEHLYTLSPPLKLALSLDPESGQFYVASDDELDIHVYAQTREQLAEEVAAQIAFNWREYAQEAPEKLAKGALLLRQRLLARVRETRA
jgi:hypothetical protein